MAASGGGAAGGPGGNIKVVVRVRPFNNRELDRKAKCIVSMADTQTVLTPPSGNDPKSKGAKASLESTKTFKFDKSYWSFNPSDSHFAGQDDLFGDLGKPLLDNAFQGYNNCIFAYGQTGSGKSYSMMGYGAEAGVIPKICRSMFERIETVQGDKNMKCTVEVSYMEIYNEKVRDLLNPSTKGNLRVREHPSTGPYVEDLAKLIVKSFKEIENLMDEGNKARTVAATNMNETSSRSHAVFTLTLTQKRHDEETSMDTEKVAKISLVDLAGSERATSTGATGARLKEGAEINRSLSTLGRVIAALADLSSGKGKKASLVPYRDSVLTWLLKDSLGGNSLTAMIAAISPADINFEETLSTLRYADSAKRIKNHAVVNEDPNARMIRELKEELAQLRSKLQGGGMISSEQYDPSVPLDQQMVTITNADGTVKRVSKAEIAEQLQASEKLYKDLNQTWEEKMLKTEEIHREREAALEELGISIEKGFIGMSTPKKMPHLVNLSDDPLLAECLVYNLKPGTTTVGNVETEFKEEGVDDNKIEIRLNGSKIMHEHCSFENVDNIVTVVPKEGAAVMVNGMRIEKAKRLRSGYRIILGDFHIFRFNHPEEARQERKAEEKTGGSLLRHSINADELDDSPSPGLRPSHGRSSSVWSRADSDWDTPDTRDGSPTPGYRGGRDSDYNFARREAITAVLGADQKIASLTDDELDVLFDDISRVRAGRKGNRFFEQGINDDDTESTTSHSMAAREKYMSNGTLDNFSLDTAITMPSTPRQGEEEEKLRVVRDELQQQLDRQKEEYAIELKQAQESNMKMEEIRAERDKMEQSLVAVREDMQRQLQEQKEQFEKQMQAALQPRPTPTRHELSEQRKRYAQKVLQHWRSRRYVSMAETVLRHAATLKEAQVMSQQMDKHVVFQFTVVDVGHTLPSSYDMVLDGIGDDDDDELVSCPKPCVAIRVADFKNSIVHLWSLSKLQKRIDKMRQMHQFLNRPEVSQHLTMANPFAEACLPEYTRIGEADVPLAAVFECRVQDFTLDLFSPYTNGEVGLIRLSLEPSSAEAPSSMLKFNVVMHDLVGFPEREGTQVHAQLFIPGVSEEGGATTTQMIDHFDEGPVRFESVHSMGIPLDSPRDSALRVTIFARATSMHLDKLLSWDDMRDSAARPALRRNQSRVAESEYFTEERHDVFTRLQIAEINEDGEYDPVELELQSSLDPGTYQLHQGLQRQMLIKVTHSSGDALQWDNIGNLRVGKIGLVDPAGSIVDSDPAQPDVPLTLACPPKIADNADGTTDVKFLAQWDTSLHRSLLLNRATADRYRVQATFSFDVSSPRLTEPMTFAIPYFLQIRGRSYIRSTALLAQLWQQTRIVHARTAMFSVSIKPSSAKRAADLWRMDTHHDYVNGEEALSGWTPRGVSLIRDYIAHRKRRRRIAEIEAAKSVFGTAMFEAPMIDGAAMLTLSDSPPDPDTETSDTPTAETKYNDHDTALLTRCLDLWSKRYEPADFLIPHDDSLIPGHESYTHAAGSRPGTRDGGAPASPHAKSKSKPKPKVNGTGTGTGTLQPPPEEEPPRKPILTAAITLMPKSPTRLKGAYVLMPDSATCSRWLRRWLELRAPYLHIYSVPGPGTTSNGAGSGTGLGTLTPGTSSGGGGGSGMGDPESLTASGGGFGIGQKWREEINAINLSHARIDAEPSVGKLLQRRQLQAGLWAVYAQRNSFIFACPGESRGAREKAEWIWGIESAFSGGEIEDSN